MVVFPCIDLLFRRLYVIPRGKSFFLWHEIGRVGEGVRVFNGCCGAYNTTFPQNLGGIWKFPTPVDSDMLLNLSQLCQSGELLNIRGGHFKHCSFSSREQ